MNKKLIIGIPIVILVAFGIGVSVYEFVKDKDDSELERSSSLFSYDPELGRGSSLSQNPLEDFKQDEAFNKEAPMSGHTKLRGGKRSKKIKRKVKGKSKRKIKGERKNKFSTLKKV